MHTIDLHVHSNFSDGTCSPEDLIELAHKKNLSAFALTDHDCVEGLEPAFAYLKKRLSTQIDPRYRTFG